MFNFNASAKIAQTNNNTNAIEDAREGVASVAKMRLHNKNATRSPILTGASSISTLGMLSLIAACGDSMSGSTSLADRGTDLGDSNPNDLIQVQSLEDDGQAQAGSAAGSMQFDAFVTNPARYNDRYIGGDSDSTTLAIKEGVGIGAIPLGRLPVTSEEASAITYSIVGSDGYDFSGSIDDCFRIDGDGNLMITKELSYDNLDLIEVGSDGRDKQFTLSIKASDGKGAFDMHTVVIRLGNEEHAGSEDSTMHGSFSDDHLYGGAGDDTIYGYDRNDFIAGHSGNDRLYGGAGKDVIWGLLGDDHLYGGAGDDMFSGWRGADQFWFAKHATSASDTNHDFIGDLARHEDDMLIVETGIRAASPSQAWTVDNNVVITDVLYNLAKSTKIIFSSWGNDDSITLYGLRQSEAEWAKDIWFHQKQTEVGLQFLYGGTDQDYLEGNAGNDYLYANAGNDYLYGELGHDKLYGGSGNDKLYGGAGNDYLYGGVGNDTLNGGSGADKLNGEDGNDHIYGGAGNDQIFGGFGNDYIEGGDGNDIIYAGIGTGALDGGFVGDTLKGDAGNDTIYGSAGNDTLDGGAGDDLLSGEVGNDTLSGGDGADRFNVYGTDSYSNGNDVIKDFSSEDGDQIVITGGGETFDSISVDNSGTHAVVTGYGADGSQLTVENAHLVASDFAFI